MSLLPRNIVIRLFRPVRPDVEQERRVRQFLYGERRNVTRVETAADLLRELGPGPHRDHDEYRYR